MMELSRGKEKFLGGQEGMEKDFFGEVKRGWKKIFWGGQEGTIVWIKKSG